MIWSATSLVVRKNAGRAPAALVGLLGLAVQASAAPTILYAVNDPALPNTFTVNFPPELGGPQVAPIPSTRFVLLVDPEKGVASIESWIQHVNPLSLAGISTGKIIVRIAGESSGFFDSEKQSQTDDGTFSTTEAYNVFFTGDLSAFGLQSPFFIPSASTGTVTYDEGSTTTGLISMEWTGLGSIPNPFDPANPFVFNYACSVNSRFVVATTCTNVEDLSIRCSRGNLRVQVDMYDESHDGDLVVVDVNGEPFPIIVNGATGAVTARKRLGNQTVSLIADESGCVEPLVFNCD